MILINPILAAEPGHGWIEKSSISYLSSLQSHIAAE